MKKKIIISILILTALLLPVIASVPALGAGTVVLQFDVNGGNGAIEDITAVSGSVAILAYPDDITPPEGKAFAHWEAGNKQYMPGEPVRMTADTVFKAVWTTPVYIYVNPNSGSNSNSGKSEKDAFKDLNTAIKALRDNNGSTYSNFIVICEPITTGTNGLSITAAVTITQLEGSNGEMDSDTGAMFNIGGTVLCKNAVRFMNISMADTGTHNLCACGNPLIMTGITTPAGSFTAATLAGGGSGNNYVKSSTETTAACDTSLRVDSGNYNVVYGGGLTAKTMDTSVIFNGGTANVLYGGSNSSWLQGNIRVTINGGTIGTLYAGTNSADVTGNAIININGGLVSSVNKDCADSSKKVWGGTTIGVSGEFIPISYNSGSGSGVMTSALQYRSGDTAVYEYPTGLSDSGKAFYAWTVNGKTVHPGDRFTVGNTYTSITADWRTVVDVYVDALYGDDENAGTTRDKPKKTLKAAAALLRTEDKGGSVYTNRINLVNGYYLYQDETLGEKPCSIIGSVLKLGVDLNISADLRLVCGVEGAGKISVSNAGLIVDDADAKIGTVEATTANNTFIAVYKGEVETINANNGFVYVYGGKVNLADKADNFRIYGGETIKVTNAKNTVLCGGKVTEINSEKCEAIVRQGKKLTVAGTVEVAGFYGGGELAFADNGLLKISGKASGTTEIRDTSFISGKTVIECPSTLMNSAHSATSDKAFYGDNIVFVPSAGSWKTLCTVSLHFSDKTETVYADESGAFALPGNLIAEGYTFSGWYTDEGCINAYTYAPVTDTLNLYTKGSKNESVMLKIAPTSGNFKYKNHEYGATENRDFYEFELSKGEVVELEALSTSIRTFMYWIDVRTNKILSYEKIFSFRIADKTEISAVFANASSGKFVVSFVGYGDRLVDSFYIERGSVINSGLIPTEADIIPGKTFRGWDADTTAKINTNTIFKAVYEDVKATVTEERTGVTPDENKIELSKAVKSESSVTFVADWKLADGATLLRAGIRIKNSAGEVVYTGYSTSTEKSGSYFVTKGNAGGTQWTAEPFVVYADANGAIYEYSGSAMTASSFGSATAVTESGLGELYMTLGGGLTIESTMDGFYDSVLDTSKESYSYDEMMDDLMELLNRHSDKMTMISIGKSVLGRELAVVQLGNTKAEYRMFVKATDHAREWMNTMIVMRQIEFYLENWNREFNGEKVSDIFERICICFEPMANPDGVMLSQQGLASIKDEDLRAKYADLLIPIMLKEQATMVKGVDYDDDLDITELMDENGVWWGRWAANINGVDLHRDYYEETLAMYNKNFANYVKKHQIPDTKDAFGSTGLSQPETKAVAEYIARFGFNMSFSYHSYSPCLQMPVALVDSAQLQKNSSLITALGKVTSYNLNSNTGTLSKDDVNAGYNNWFICKYPQSACFTIETGYRAVNGHTDNTPLKMAQFEKLACQNKYGPLYIAILAADNGAVGALK